VTSHAGGPGRSIVSAIKPGVGRIDGGLGWSSIVRVRRHRFEGRSIFRHLEDDVE
jgi:hypothetical protein